MSSIARWDPLLGLQRLSERLNRWFASIQARRAAVAEVEWAPAVDIQESETEYLIQAELPEVKKDEVCVEVQDGMLRIEGRRRPILGAHHCERHHGAFVRNIDVPRNTDPSRMMGKLEDGVLSLHLPKTEAPKLHKPIEIEIV